MIEGWEPGYAYGNRVEHDGAAMSHDGVDLFLYRDLSPCADGWRVPFSALTRGEQRALLELIGDWVNGGRTGFGKRWRGLIATVQARLDEQKV